MTPQEATEGLFKAARHGNVSDTRECLEAGANVEAKDEWLMTPLHLAVENGHTCVARLLIERGHANRSVSNREGDTPLHLAAYHGHIDLVQLLISRAADTTLKNRCEYTPLHLASLQEHNAIANLLESVTKRQAGYAARVETSRRHSDERGVG